MEPSEKELVVGTLSDRRILAGFCTDPLRGFLEQTPTKACVKVVVK